VSCLLNRTISHPLIVGSVSGLSTSQINKSRVVLKSRILWFVMLGRNAYETHTFRPRNHGGSHLVSLYKTSTHTGYHVKIEIHILTVWTTDSYLMQAYWEYRLRISGLKFSLLTKQLIIINLKETSIIKNTLTSALEALRRVESKQV
jgi:hypothetical protein